MLRRRTLLTSLSAAALASPALAAGRRPTREPAWRALAPMPGVAQEIYPTVWNGRILVAGGFSVVDGFPSVTDRAYLYDPSADAWTDGPKLPDYRHHPQLLVAADRLFCIGGFDFDTEGPETGAWRMHGTAWRYDEDAAAWAEAPPLPAPRAETVGLVHEDRIHLIGGRTPKGQENLAWEDHVDTTEHLVLDPGAGRWETAAPAPTARNSAAGVVLDGRLWIVGGRRVDAGNNAELEVYDPQADRWETRAPMPQGQGGLAAGVLDGKIVAFGGEWFSETNAGVHPETWLYDPARDAWEPGPDMLTPRHGLGGVSLGAKVYAVGGATGPSTEGTSGVLEVLEAS